MSPTRNHDSLSENEVLTRATIRAADRFEVSQKILASVLGVSEPVVSRMRNGSFTLERSKGKTFELATWFVRLCQSLDAIVGGDEAVARAWLKSDNIALRGRPIDLIQKVQGLLDVIQYLDDRRVLI